MPPSTLGASEEATLYHRCKTDVMLRWLTVNHPLSSTFQTLDVRDLYVWEMLCWICRQITVWKSTLKSPKLSHFCCLNVFVQSQKHIGRVQAAQHIHVISSKEDTIMNKVTFNFDWKFMPELSVKICHFNFLKIYWMKVVLMD